MFWDDHVNTVRRELEPAGLHAQLRFGQALSLRAMVAYSRGVAASGAEEKATRANTWIGQLWTSALVNDADKVEALIAEVEAAMPGEDDDSNWVFEQESLTVVHSFLRILPQANARAVAHVAENMLNLAYAKVYERISPHEYSEVADKATEGDSAMLAEIGNQQQLLARCCAPTPALEAIKSLALEAVGILEPRA